MLRNIDNLKTRVVTTMDAYVRSHPNTSALEVLGVLEDIRHAVTEELIKQHPELIWTLSKGKT